jgi:rhodanese-related sulfurtransferase
VRRAPRLAAGVLALCAVSCTTTKKVVASLTANCRQMEPGVAHEMLRDNPSVLLIDVRHAEEYTTALPHVFHAREIPLSELPRRWEEVAGWKDSPVVVFSRDGTGAASACDFLGRQGFRYVSWVAGGVEEWQKRRFLRGSGGGSGARQ